MARPSSALLTVAGTAHAANATGTADTTAQEPRRAARLWLEAGPSLDRTEFQDNRSQGYAIAGGAEVGRTFSLTLGIGFEHYPFARAAHLIHNNSTVPPVLRVEGGGGSSVQLRFGIVTR